MSRNLSKITAWLLYIVIFALYAFSLWALFQYRDNDTFFSFVEVGNILKYSLWQAFLSATLSTLLGILLAKAFFYLEFKGKAFLYKIILFVWSLPSLVIIFAVIGVWGNAGWFSQIFQFLGLEWQFNLYGLQGILIAHCLLNIPLVTKYGLEALNQISSSQYRLAMQLNLSGWHYFSIVELPTLKRILPYLFITLFLICFTSFPIVLMLGGSPKYSTLEVAIYQAVSFEFDFAKAIMLIMVQIVVGLLLQALLFMISQRAFNEASTRANVELWKPIPFGWNKRFLQTVLVLQSFLIILPLVSTLWAGIRVSAFWEKLLAPELWQAAFYSLLLSLMASITAVGVAYFIALETRQLQQQKQQVRYSLLSGVVSYPLVLPVFLLAVGLFLLLMNIELSTAELIVLVGVCNGLTLLPFIYPLLFSILRQLLVTQEKLATSLGLTGWDRWWIAEKHYLYRPLLNAFMLAMSSSLGSFAVIAFFGSPDFSSLPYLLYQQLGSYRTEEAAVTALVLMLFALLPFWFTKIKQNG